MVRYTWTPVQAPDDKTSFCKCVELVALFDSLEYFGYQQLCSATIRISSTLSVVPGLHTGHCCLPKPYGRLAS